MVDLPEPERPVNQSTQGCWPFSRGARRLVDGERLPMDVGRRAAAPNWIMPAPTVRIGEAVDQDEAAGLAVLGVRIEDERLGRARDCTKPISFSSSVLPATWSRLSTLSLYFRLETVRRRGLAAASSCT